MTKTRRQSNAQKLLREYRPALWRKSTLETVPGVKHNALSICVAQICLTQELVETLKADKLLGEKMYRIIRAAYMTDKQPHDVEEILADIAKKYGYIPRRTYFRLKKRAVEMMDSRLEAMERPDRE